jgi:hypothetical protein
MDSIETWNLLHHDSLASVSFSYEIDTVNLAVIFNENLDYVDSILWDFGDGNTSSISNPLHSYNEAGEYTVQLIGYSPCSGDTTTQNILIEIPFGGLELLQAQNKFTLKRYSEYGFKLESLTKNELNDVQVIDMMGRSIAAEINQINATTIEFNLVQKGQLILTFELNGQPRFVRFYH